MAKVAYRAELGSNQFLYFHFNQFKFKELSPVIDIFEQKMIVFHSTSE